MSSGGRIQLRPLKTNGEHTIYESSREGTIIPREIISWLQLLRISHTIKFPKRDLSNGYLVAQICSLYWPDVAMHSFRNRLSLAAKRENWELLTKAFARNGVPLSHKVIEGMILCKDHYAESFLRQLYTLLTGKEIVDAKPFRKAVVEADVYNPGVLAQQMKSTMEAYRSLKESEEKINEDKPPGVGNTVDQAPRADLHNLPDISLPSTTASEKKSLGVQPIRTFNPDTSGEDGDLTSGAPTTEDGRSGFEFEVEVRSAEHTSTVVKEPILAVRRVSLGSTVQSQTDPNAATKTAGGPLSATEWVESIVKRFADDGWRLTPDCPTYMQFLLQHEGDLEGSVQGAIWNALLSRIGELVDTIKHNSVALGEVVNLMLVSPDGKGGGGGLSTTGMSITGSVSRRESMETMASVSAYGATSKHRRQNTPVVTSPKVFMFLAAILSHLTDLDPFYALSAFIRSVLSFPSIQLVLRRLNYHLADMYASLMCSVISTDQDTALALLPDLLSAAYESITGSDSSTDAKTSFLVLLRSIISRMVRPGRLQPSQPPASESSIPNTPTKQGPGSLTRAVNTPTGMSSRTTEPSQPTSPLKGSPTSHHAPAVFNFAQGSKRDLSSDLHTIASLNTVSALTSESVQVRTVGAAVAATLALTGYPVYHSIAQFKKLLFPYGAQTIPGTLQPMEYVMRATWLRSVQERLCLQETNFSADNASTTEPPREPPRERRRSRSPGVKSGRGARFSISSSSQSEVKPGGDGLSTRDLLPLFYGAANFLTFPGGHKKAKTLIAFELAISLLYLPLERLAVSGIQYNSMEMEPSATADEVANAVMKFFIHQCTSDLVAVIVAPPTDSSGGHSSGNAGGGGSSNSKAARANAATFGRGKEVGCLMVHPVLGPLCVQDMLRRTCPVLLCRALYHGALPSDLDTKDAARRLGVRAAALARERSAPPDMLRRVQWLFWIIVSGRGFQPIPETTPFISKRQMRRRWREVLFDAYDDIAMITGAGETLMSQRSRVDEQAQSLIELGTKCRRVVLRWHTSIGALVSAGDDDRGADILGGPNHKKSFLLEPNSIYEESAEKMHQAMEWYHSSFHPGMRGEEE